MKAIDNPLSGLQFRLRHHDGHGVAQEATHTTTAVSTNRTMSAIIATRPDMAATRALPWYAWLVGAYGACFVVAAAWGVPRLGVAMTITLMVGGQLLISLILDHFGALGVPRQPLNIGRIAGVALVLGGVLLVRRS